MSLNLTKLKSFANLPDWQGIFRIEAAENQITGAELSNLQKYSDTLVVLKLANNRILNIDEIKTLSSFKKLKNLDLGQNPITKIEGYRDKIFALLPELEVLDGHDRENQSVLSDINQDSYGEEGEQELYGDEDEDGVLRQNGEDDFSDYDEEGEDEFDESESEEVA